MATLGVAASLPRRSPYTSMTASFCSGVRVAPNSAVSPDSEALRYAPRVSGSKGPGKASLSLDRIKSITKASPFSAAKEEPRSWGGRGEKGLPDVVVVVRVVGAGRAEGDPELPGPFMRVVPRPFFEIRPGGGLHEPVVGLFCRPGWA